METNELKQYLKNGIDLEILLFQQEKVINALKKERASLPTQCTIYPPRKSEYPAPPQKKSRFKRQKTAAMVC